VLKPLPQGRAGRDFLPPPINLCLGFGNTARPEAIHQHAIPVFSRGFFVGSLDLERHFATMIAAAWRSRNQKAF